MYGGRICEYGPKRAVLGEPLHPYTARSSPASRSRPRGRAACKLFRGSRRRRLPATGLPFPSALRAPRGLCCAAIRSFGTLSPATPRPAMRRAAARACVMTAPLLDVRDLVVSFAAGDTGRSGSRGARAGGQRRVLPLRRAKPWALSGSRVAARPPWPRHHGSHRQRARSCSRERTCSTARANSWQAFRRETAMIFQDPYNALNPRMRVGDIIGEVLHVHEKSLARSAGGGSWSSCRWLACRPNMRAASPRHCPGDNASGSESRAPLRLLRS